MLWKRRHGMVYSEGAFTETALKTLAGQVYRGYIMR